MGYPESWAQQEWTVQDCGDGHIRCLISFADAHVIRVYCRFPNSSWRQATCLKGFYKNASAPRRPSHYEQGSCCHMKSALQQASQLQHSGLEDQQCGLLYPYAVAYRSPCTGLPSSTSRPCHSGRHERGKIILPTYLSMHDRELLNLDTGKCLLKASSWLPCREDA